MSLTDSLSHEEAIRAIAAQVAATSSGENEVVVSQLLRKAAQVEHYIRTGNTRAQY